MVHSGVLFKFLAGQGPSNVTGPGAPYPTLSTGLAYLLRWQIVASSMTLIRE